MIVTYVTDSRHQDSQGRYDLLVQDQGPPILNERAPDDFGKTSL